jgi:hypothetical protein
MLRSKEETFVTRMRNSNARGMKAVSRRRESKEKRKRKNKEKKKIRK